MYHLPQPKIKHLTPRGQALWQQGNPKGTNPKGTDPNTMGTDLLAQTPLRCVTSTRKNTVSRLKETTNDNKKLDDSTTKRRVFDTQWKYSAAGSLRESAFVNFLSEFGDGFARSWRGVTAGGGVMRPLEDSSHNDLGTRPRVHAVSETSLVTSALFPSRTQCSGQRNHHGRGVSPPT